MNKAELIEVISNKVGISKKEAEDSIDCLTDSIIERLKKGEEVTITGFGAFSAKVRAARKGVNPRNPSQKIDIPEVTVPKFKAGKVLKESLKSKGESESSEAPTEDASEPTPTPAKEEGSADSLGSSEPTPSTDSTPSE
ncbi:DNA-binding protein [bacterium]|nr:DNA-binding protein [bacterium]